MLNLNDWLSNNEGLFWSLIFSAVLLVISTLLCIYLYFTYRRIGRLKKILRAKTLFIQKIAYEIRGPLNGVLGFTQMLAGNFFGDLNIRQKERIKDINRCGIEISRVIDDLLDLSNANNVDIELVKSRMSVEELVMIPLSHLESRIRQSKVVVALHLNNQDSVALFDRQKILFVIRHIIDNAVKFSKPGGQITIATEICKGKLYVTVADSGHGMKLEELETAFLYPDDENKSRNQGGIGLGLPLSQLFAHLHNGEITIESAPEVGTTVTVSLPI